VSGAIFTQFLLPGLTTGCVYALVALGLVLTANVSGIVNFAQGEFVMLGGVLSALLLQKGIPLVPAILLAVLAGGVVGALQERLTVAPVRGANHFILITITFGVAVVLRGLALILFGKDPLLVAGFSGDGTFRLLGAVLPIQTLWVWSATAAMLAAIFWFLQYTDQGRAVRACAVNRQAAQLMGIDVGRATFQVFAASGAVGALAGVIVAPIFLASWDAGIGYGLKGFTGAIIAGFRSPGRAVAGALALGCVEALAAGYISSGWRDFILYGLLIAFLLIRGGVFASGRSGALAR